MNEWISFSFSNRWILESNRRIFRELWTSTWWTLLLNLSIDFTDFTECIYCDEFFGRIFFYFFNLISRQQNFETDGFGFSSCELLRNRGPVPFWQRFRMFSANVTSNYWTFWHFSSPLFNLNFDFRLDLNQFPSLWKMVANLRVHNSSFLEVQLFKPVEKLESRGLDIQLRMDINIK